MQALQKQNALVQEIHDSFYNEVDVLEKWATKLDEPQQIDKSIVDKARRLRELGFVRAKEIDLAQHEARKNDKIDWDNRNKNRIARAIVYFGFKYPNYKFITSESVEALCKKYSLAYGEVGAFTGSVPDENLETMERFKVEDSDCYYKERRQSMADLIIESQASRSPFGSMWGADMATDSERILRNSMAEINDELVNRLSGSLFNRRGRKEKQPLEIVAPIKDFDTENFKIEGSKVSKIEVPDPIVLQPVVFDNEKFYLIVTAWGLESLDEEVVNQKFN